MNDSVQSVRPGLQRKQASTAPDTGDGWFLHTAGERNAILYVAATGTFILATATALLAQGADMPRTAAVVYLLGVTLVGGIVGLWGGLLAAFIASLTYNFFLSDPQFRFSLSSVEELVPLLAFNLSAAASGLLAGRLKDRALAAEVARARMRSLFNVSRKLQAAVRLEDIPDAIVGFTGAAGDPQPELYVADGENLRPLQSGHSYLGFALGVFQRRLLDDRQDAQRALLLSTSDGPSGVLVIPWSSRASRRDEEHDLEAFVNVLSITLERCSLLQRVSEAELIRRSEELKTALLSSVSHDMRTPLSAISASASSLARYGSDLSEETRVDLLTMIQEQCDRLNRYTSNLLNLGRLQAGVDPGQFVDCDAVEALGSATSRVRSLESGREIEKRYGVDSALVRADPVMLEQAFYNVLENAVRYSPPDLPITVSAILASDWLLISIQDEGPGIAREDLTKVFDRFYRSRSDQVPEGSGLGLSIAKGFVEAFGGSIRAERADPRLGGTIIRIELPISGLSEHDH